jgi:hypothetical protein
MSEFDEQYYTRDTLSSFDPTIFFEGYDHVEEYDDTKTYTKEHFEVDYGHGVREYHYILYTIGDIDGKMPDKKYVAVREVLSQSELRKLAKHCQCEKCTKYYFNPMRYFTCGCCVGCLSWGNGFYSPAVLKKTREYIKIN